MGRQPQQQDQDAAAASDDPVLQTVNATLEKLSESPKLLAEVRAHPAVAILLSVHALGSVVKPRPLAASRQLSTQEASRAPPAVRALRYYAAGESLVITASALRGMSDELRDVVAFCLWLADFKWVEGSHKRGIGTRVHFGYAPMYGSKPWDVKQLRPPQGLRFTGSQLWWQANHRAAINNIEVPLNKGWYVMVRKAR